MSTQNSKQFVKNAAPAAAPSDGDDARHEQQPKPSVQQMFATLLGEISSLRNENKESHRTIHSLSVALSDVQDKQDQQYRVSKAFAKLAAQQALRTESLEAEIQALHQHVETCATTVKDEVLILHRDDPTCEGQRTWREQLVTRRKVDRLFEMLDTAGPVHQLPHFHKLPLELRQYIWRLAVPQRMTCIDKPDKYSSLPTTLSIPAVAHVCRESRAAVALRCKQSGIWAPTLPQTDVPVTQSWQIRDDRGKLWTWFTQERDILMIRPDTPLDHPMKQVVQHIVIGSGDTYYNMDFGGEYGGYPQDSEWPAPAAEEDHVDWQETYFEWLKPTWPQPIHTVYWEPLGKPHVWPRLHTIDLLMNGTTVVDKRYSPGFRDQLFQGDDVKLVDLTDKEAIEKIWKLHREHNRPPARFDLDPMIDNSVLYSDFSHAMDRFEGLPMHTPRRQFFHYAQNRIRCLYLHQHEHWVPLDRSRRLSWFITTADGESPNMDIPWVRELLGKLRIRPVHAFVRENRRDPWEDVPAKIETTPSWSAPQWTSGWQLQEGGN